MKGTKHFIIHIPQLHTEEIETQSGVKLFADKRFSARETANTIFKVVEVPFGYDGPIKKGWWLMIDSTMIFEQTYEKGGKQENEYLLNREKRHFKIDASLVICFRESETGPWIGFKENVICERVKAEKKDFEKVGSLFMPNTAIPKSVKGQMKVIISNSSLNGFDVNEGDIVFVNQKLSVPISIDGKAYEWLRTGEILAKNNAA